MLALTHRSFAHENGGIPTNERLEFLGDTVLGLVVTETLYRRHPDLSEGELAKMRAATVSQKSLAAIARRLGLGQYVLLGKGEIRTRGNDKDSILSDTVEAIIGAVYLSHGLEPARGLVLGLVEPTLSAAAGLGAGLDWEASLPGAAAAAGVSARGGARGGGAGRGGAPVRRRGWAPGSPGRPLSTRPRPRPG